MNELHSVDMLSCMHVKEEKENAKKNLVGK